MAKKPTSKTAQAADESLSAAVRESAQQIWLAGLGAFAKAQEEGGKAFDVLVQEGLSLQRKTQAVAEERMAEATGRMNELAQELGSKAVGRLDKIETMVEERVSRALKRLGVPSSREVQALMEQVHALNARVMGMASPSAKAAPAKQAPAKKAPAKKSAAKTAPSRAATAPAPAAKTRRAPARKAPASRD